MRVVRVVHLTVPVWVVLAVWVVRVARVCSVYFCTVVLMVWVVRVVFSLFSCR